MTFLFRLFLLLVISLVFAWNFVASVFAAGHLVETRYCWPIVRDANGVIVRSAAVYREFRKIYPCPTTGLTYGPCAGWAANHDRPLACGGCDHLANLSWMRDDAKKLHDSYERKIYGKYPNTNCTAPPLR